VNALIQLLPVPPSIAKYIRESGIIGDVHFVGLDNAGVPVLVSFDAKGLPYLPTALPDFVAVGASIPSLSASARAQVDAKPKVGP
jgi:hypothetical protein